MKTSAFKILTDGIQMGPNMKGVGRYVAQTLQHLSALDSSFQFSVLVFQGTLTNFLPQNSNIRYIPIPQRKNIWHWVWTLPLWVRRIRPDIVWFPYEMPLALTNTPYVMVCHDIPKRIREAQKQGGNGGISLKECLRGWIDDALMPKTLRKAEIVFSNSQYVGNWLEKEAGVEPSRIRHAPCAPGSDFQRLSRGVDVERVWQKLKTPHGYILVFNTGDQRENFKIVPRVFQTVLEAGLPHDLVVGGVRDNARSFVEATLSRFPWFNRIRIVPFLGSGREQELAEIYTAASVYLDPSLQEGFGMQVIEAMACGTPVVCSNRGALPEVAGDAALLVNPEDSDQISSTVKRVLADKALNRQLTERGYARASAFSWGRTARVIYEGLSDVARMKGNSPECIRRITGEWDDLRIERNHDSL